MMRQSSSFKVNTVKPPLRNKTKKRLDSSLSYHNQHRFIHDSRSLPTYCSSWGIGRPKDSFSLFTLQTNGFQNHQYHTSTTNLFAIKIQVGYGEKNKIDQLKSGEDRGTNQNVHNPNLSPTNELSIDSSQRKNANIELLLMKEQTNKILNIHHITPQQIDPLANQVRVTIHYWVSRWHAFFHPASLYSLKNYIHDLYYTLGDNKSSDSSVQDESLYADYGVRQAMKLIRWTIYMNDLFPQFKLLQKILAIDNNATFINLIEASLIPCTNHTFHHHFVNSSKLSSQSVVSAQQNVLQQDQIESEILNIPRDDNNFLNNSGEHSLPMLMRASTKIVIHPQRWIPSLFVASQIIDIMNKLHETNELLPDLASQNATLMVWSRLCLLVAYMQKNVNSIGGNGGNYNRNDESQHSVIDWYNNNSYAMDTETQNFHPADSSALDVPTTCQMATVNEILNKMETKIESMEMEYNKTQNGNMKPDEYTYNIMITTLTRSNDTDGHKRAEWYLRRMELTEDYDLNCSSFQNGNIQNPSVLQCNAENFDFKEYPRTTTYADTVFYNNILHAYAAITHQFRNNKLKYQAVSASKQAMHILKRMEDRFSTNKRKSAQPDTISYSTVLNSVANVGDAEEAENILDKIIALSHQDEYIGIVQPNIICFNTAINAWAKVKNAKSAEKAYQLFLRMKELKIIPDTITYSAMITAFARSGRLDGADRAQQLLDESLRLYEAGHENMKPDSIMFNTVLDALAKRCIAEYNKHKGREPYEGNDENMKHVVNATQKAEALLEYMHKLQDDNDFMNIRPCTISYNILVDMCAKSGQPHKAEQLYHKMNDSYLNKGKTHLKPDLITFNSVILGLSMSSNPNDLMKAEKLLYDMEKMDPSNGELVPLEPDIISYNIILNALAKKHNPKSAMKAEELLLTLEHRCNDGTSSVKPNTISYNCCIDAWAKSRAKDASHRAETIFNKLFLLSRNSSTKNLGVDSHSFTLLLDAVARSNDPDAPDRAEGILNKMKLIGIPPNRYTYNAVINCWARSGKNEAAEKAEEILLNMIDQSEKGMSNLKPDEVTFSSVMNCWARSKDKGAAERAERILTLLEDNDFKPSPTAYATVINAWSKSFDICAPERAIALLNKMERSYEHGNESLRPNAYCFNSVLNTIAKSNSPSKASEADLIFERMRQSFKNGNPDARPTIMTYATILNACAYSQSEEEKVNAFNIARKRMKELLIGEGNLNLNSIVFGTFLIACETQLSPGNIRDNWIRTVFKDCCQRGLVDVKIICIIRRSLPEHILLELLNETTLAKGHIELDDIPQSWRSKVENKYPTRRQ